MALFTTNFCDLLLRFISSSDFFTNYKVFLQKFEPKFYMRKNGLKKIEKEKKDNYLILIDSLISKMENIILDSKNDFEKTKNESQNIFICEEKINIINDIFENHIEDLESEKLNAEKLKSEIINYATI